MPREEVVPGCKVWFSHSNSGVRVGSSVAQCSPVEMITIIRGPFPGASSRLIGSDTAIDSSCYPLSPAIFTAPR